MLPSKYNGRRLLVALGLAATSLAVAGATPAHAQWAVGAWEDGSVAPRGMLRIGATARWTHANERFARLGTTTESLGADFTRDSLGPLVPFGAIRQQLQTLTGLNTGPLSLGGLRVGIESMSWSTPITIDYGVTRRLSIGVLVPYVKNRVEVFANPLTSTATLGVNPAYTRTAARTQNGLVVSQLQGAAQTLQTQLTTCVNSATPQCAAINADRAGASALVANATAAAASVAAVYGTNSVAGSPLSPLGSRTLHTAVNSRLSALSQQFAAFLGNATSGDWVGARPVGAPPIGATDLQRVLGDSVFGIVAAPFSDIERSHLGDIEVGAKALLLDSFGASTGSSRRFAVRVAAAGVVRLGTGQRDRPNDFADIGTGDGQTDVEARGYLDVRLTRRWWLSAIARYGVQMSDRLFLRVPDALGEPFPPLAATAEVDRDLGDYAEFELSPRFSPNPNLTFSANYRLRSKQSDTYALTSGAQFLPAVFDMSRSVMTLGLGTAQREQRLGFVLTYSTVSGYSRRRAPWPLDVTLSHTQVTSGKGGVPKEFVTSVGLRLYRPLIGRDALRR